jgi:hypothetical protein
MAGQQQQIIDTIFSMKRKILRGNDGTRRLAPTLALSLSSLEHRLTATVDAGETDSPFADYRQDLKRKSQYARASDPDFLSDPRPYKKVRSPHMRRLGPD